MWEYGVGSGYIHYEQYPASDQFSNIALPFPTFQYRGEILRANDREGARTYLFKKDAWSLEISGGGYPPLDSAANKAREGMEDLPFMINVGPQVVYEPLSENWEIKVGLFQVTSISGDVVKKNGAVLDTDFIYHFDFGPTQGRLSAGFKIVSQELQATYFDVSGMDATTDRPAYEAKGGFLDSEFAYFHSYTTGRLSLYLGFGLTDYSSSVNRSSPLHKSNFNISYLVGFTYVLGESERRSVPTENTQGIINKYRTKRANILPFE